MSDKFTGTRAGLNSFMNRCVHRIAPPRPLQVAKGWFWPICEVLAHRGSIGSPVSCAREYGSVLLMRRYHFDEETGTP